MSLSLRIGTTLVLVFLSLSIVSLAQHARPAVDYQTSYGQISFINEHGGLEIRLATTSIDPKSRLYRSDQSTPVDALILYANTSHLTYVHHNYCYIYPYVWIFDVDYFFKTEYRGTEMITTKYFANVTCNRFHGSPPDYDYEFDLYTMPNDPDFIVRQVTYSRGNFHGSVLDHERYTYDMQPSTYWKSPCLGQNKRSIKNELPDLNMDTFLSLVTH